MGNKGLKVFREVRMQNSKQDCPELHVRAGARKSGASGDKGRSGWGWMWLGHWQHVLCWMQRGCGCEDVPHVPIILYTFSHPLDHALSTLLRRPE